MEGTTSALALVDDVLYAGGHYYVIDRRLGVAGAQPLATFQAALAQAWGDPRPAAV